jgi:L-alanine-DL-glutamate epimerase-like enolase superfamily enzyme
MTDFNRRKFMSSGAVGISLLAGPVGLLQASSSGPSPTRARGRGAMRITDVEMHEVLIPYHDYHAATLFRYHGLGGQLRTIYVVRTDGDLEGYGESWGPAPKENPYTPFIGTDPFDWMADPHHLPMNMALYDLMGKFLGMPVWKLIGPKVRSWVPVSAWTVSQTPDAMAEEVSSVSKRGYHWMKYHVDVLQNVVDQTAAMQKVAPHGFKVHYDFNGDSTFEAVYPVLRELEKFPVAGRIEDPIQAIDHAGYRILRQKCSLPIIVHHAPADFFMLHNLCDGFMAGHAPLGEAMKLAALAQATNTPFMLQQCGGTINQSFLAHEAAVLGKAIIDHVSLCHLWNDDVAVEDMPVVGGSVQVPDKPGLGVTLDREKLRRYAGSPRPKQTRFLVRVRYAQGPTIYFRFNPDAPGANLRFLPGNIPGPTPGYGNRVITDFWEEEGSEEFDQIWKRTGSGPTWKE